MQNTFKETSGLNYVIVPLYQVVQIRKGRV